MRKNIKIVWQANYSISNKKCKEQNKKTQAIVRTDHVRKYFM